MVETVDEMPTECERSDVTLCGQQQQQQGEIEAEQRLTQQAQQNNQQQLMQHKINTVEKTIESESYTMEDVKELATNGEMSTSQTSTTSTTSSTNENGTSNGGSKRASIISPDPTAYVTKARVTRPTPPPPSYNPMQFVQIKPSHLYQTAQQQLKKAEEVKKIKEIKKEEPEDWQNNLDNWKSSRRKRVEHIIDRVVEVKKLELEEHDRSRRKSKTFSEMIEERSERGARGRTKLASLAVYNEDESNDLSDLGIGTSSASGKSSLSEDYDNNSVMSDNVTELDKAVLLNKNAQQQIQQNNCKINNNHLISNNNNNNRGYVSSPGYDTSSSTAPASSPDPCEYTYEGAIQDYKQRVSRAASSGIGNGYKLKTSASKESTPERQTIAPVYPTRRGSKIEDRLIGFEVSSPSDSQECVEKQKVVVPKIDISKRKEVFEQTLHTNEPKSSVTTNGIPKVTLRERFNAPTAKIAETNSKQDLKRMSGDMTSIRDRLQNLEQQKSGTSTVSNGNNNKLGDITVPPLKERLSCLHSAAAKEDVKKKPVQLVDDRQLEIMKTEDENAKQRYKAQLASNNLIADIETELGNTLEQLSTAANSAAKAEEAQLNAAIAALEVEEQKLEAAANAVNKIEAEFAELSDEALLNTTVGTTTTTATTNEMEFSVSDTNENLVKHSIVTDTSGVVSSNDKISNSQELSNSKLQRKPTNEMVHHRNLLKMFRDTFNTDIIEQETANEEQSKLDFEDPIVAAGMNYTPYTNVNINAEDMRVNENLHKNAHSMIPRSVVSSTTVVGKPPMSPKIPRSQKFAPSPSPLGSTPPAGLAESQFSINGRVEIFNSKSFINNTENSGSKKSTPTLPRKSFLPHLISNNNNNIGSGSTATDAGTTTAMVTAKVNEPLPMVSNQSSLDIDVDRKLMSQTTVTEPQVIRSIVSTTNKGIIVKQEALKDQQQLQEQHLQQQQQEKKKETENEVVMCAPPVTILNPDELPKPNTVKSLASCFSNANDVVDGCKMTPPSPVLLPPRPLPRGNVSKLPRQIPSPIQTETTETSKLPKRNLGNNHTAKTSDTEASEIPTYGTVILYKTVDKKPLVSPRAQPANPLKPNDSLATLILEPAVEPQLVSCSPNSSSLFKLAGSTPSSPLSQRSNSSSAAAAPSQTDIALCEDLLDALATQAHIEPVSEPPKLQHQNTVEEVVCTKVDVKKMPAGHAEPSTGYADVSVEDIERCDGLEFAKKKVETNHMSLAQNDLCVEDKQLSYTKNNAQSIDEARTAHTKQLIETCERIIAEERLASSRLKSAIAVESQNSVVNTQKSNQTPLMQRKSKIPLPKGMSCLKGSESMNSADLEQSSQEEGPLIARLHVVETQIKVTTTSPPQSPSLAKKTQKSHIPAPAAAAASPTPTKKTKNIFDFLKKNFGHHEETNTPESKTSVGELGSNEVKSKSVMNEDEIHTFENSKFYLPTKSETETETDVPPPLPSTPAPVNIEIKKTITTNEILEAANTELGLSQEINELLDDELNKLTLEKGASVSGAK